MVKKATDRAHINSLDEITANAMQAATIQYFKVSYELCWKFIQRWIAQNRSREDALFVRTRKDLFRMAASYGLIQDPLPWFAYGDARNLTSHTYNEDRAKEVFEVALSFIKDAADLLNRLKQHND